MDFTRATEATDEVKAQIKEAFEYKPWDADKKQRGEMVRKVLADAVVTIVNCVPPSPDRSAAIRKIRESRMDCNSAISFDGKL